MITEKDLTNLGYNKKQDSPKNTGADYRYGEPGERDYLIHLSNDGILTVVNSQSSKRKPIVNVTDLERFQAWHNSYEE